MNEYRKSLKSIKSKLPQFTSISLFMFVFYYLFFVINSIFGKEILVHSNSIYSVLVDGFNFSLISPYIWDIVFSTFKFYFYLWFILFISFSLILFMLKTKKTITRYYWLSFLVLSFIPVFLIYFRSEYFNMDLLVVYVLSMSFLMILYFLIIDFKTYFIILKSIFLKFFLFYSIYVFFSILLKIIFMALTYFGFHDSLSLLFSISRYVLFIIFFHLIIHGLTYSRRGKLVKSTRDSLGLAFKKRSLILSSYFVLDFIFAGLLFYAVSFLTSKFHYLGFLMFIINLLIYFMISFGVVGMFEFCLEVNKNKTKI